jgi:hypothetical protein
MATFASILIGTGFIGSDTVQVTESNGAGSLNQLLASVGNEKYIIDSFEIWSDDPAQLEQPIGLIHLSPDGNFSNKLVIPTKSVNQITNVIKYIDSANFPLDENTRISYNILPNAVVRFTLNINQGARKDNSLIMQLNQMGAKSIRPEVLKDLGYREPEEMNKWKTASDKEFMQAVGEILQPQKKENVSVKKLIIAGLVLIAGAYVLYAISDGAATSFYKK